MASALLQLSMTAGNQAVVALLRQQGKLGPAVAAADPVLARFRDENRQSVAGGAAQAASGAAGGAAKSAGQAAGGGVGAAVGGAAEGAGTGLGEALGAAGAAVAGAAGGQGQAVGQAVGGAVGAAGGAAGGAGQAAGQGAAGAELPLSGPAFNAEVDQRFYAQTGYEQGKKLDPKRAEDAPFMKIWLAIRDQVLAERTAARGAAGAGAAAGEAAAQGAAQGAAAGGGAAGGAAGQAPAQGGGAGGAAVGQAAAQGAAAGGGAAGGAAGQAPAQGAAAGGAAVGQAAAQGAAAGGGAAGGGAAGHAPAQGAAAGGGAAGGAPAQGAAAGGAAVGQAAAQGAAAGGGAAGGAAGQAAAQGVAAGGAAAGQAATHGAGQAAAQGGAQDRASTLPPELQPDRTPQSQPPAQPQSAQNPASGINWEEVFSPMNVARGVFEVGRLVPVAGLASGVIADGLQHVADMQSLEGVEVPEWMETLITLRNAVNLINNAIGHVLYVDELIQDGLLASVEFAPFASITALVHEIGDGGKLALDGIQLLLDVGITAGAEYQAMQAPPGSDAAKKWTDFSRNYAANILGDMLTTFLDILGLATGGTTQSSAMQQAARAAKPVIKALRFAKNAIMPLIQSWWNIYGGNVLPEGVTRSVVYGIIQGELGRMKMGYDITDLILEQMVKTFTQQRDDAYKVAQQLLGGRDPFTTLRDMSVQAMNEAQGQIGKVAQMEVFAGTALEKADWIRGLCTDLTGKIDSLQVPNVQIKPPDLGEGALADVAEGVLGAGAAVANAGLQLLADQIKGAVEQGKGALKAPIEGVQQNADEIAEFMTILQRHAQQQVVDMQQWIADVGGRLAKCQNFEQVVDLAIREVMQFAGIEGEFKIEDIRQGWRDVGTMINQAIDWAQGQGSTPPPQGAPQTGPRAAPGEPPDQPGQGARNGQPGAAQPAGQPAGADPNTAIA